MDLLRQTAQGGAGSSGEHSQACCTQAWMPLHYGNEKMQAAISVCIARRAARMSLACWPQDALQGGSRRANAAVAENFQDDPHA